MIRALFNSDQLGHTPTVFQYWCCSATASVFGVQDLVDPSTSREIVIREKSCGETFVEGLCRVDVTDEAHATHLIEEAEKRRAQAPTTFSDASSRSHVVALVYVEQRTSPGMLTKVGATTNYTMVVAHVVQAVRTDRLHLFENQARLVAQLRTNSWCFTLLG